jgi:hypothetical protein
VPSYATSDVDGLAVFYELLSLEEAIAEERAADEQYREELGAGFRAHVEAQLEIVRATYAAGLAWGRAYSTRTPDGEFGTHVLAGLQALSREQFQAARERSWTVTSGAKKRGPGGLDTGALSFV